MTLHKAHDQGKHHSRSVKVSYHHVSFPFVIQEVKTQSGVWSNQLLISLMVMSSQDG